MDTGIDKTELEATEVSTPPAEEAKTPAEEPKPNSQGEGQDEPELYVDDEEGDHKKPNMSQEAAYAAFRKEQKKRKEKQKLIDAEKERADKLQREIDELKTKVGKITKGSPPTMESCGYDEEVFQARTREYYESSPDTPTPKPSEHQDQVSNDEADFYLYQKEQDIIQVLPSYSEKKEALKKAMTDRGIDDTEGAIAFMSNLAMQKGVDVAKAMVAMSERPTIIDELIRAGTNQIAQADIISQAAGRVKTRTKKAIDSQPEPNINNTGPIDSANTQVKQLREAWVKNPTSKNYAIYQAAKSKLNSKVNSDG